MEKEKKDNEGGSSEVRAESLEGNNLSELLNMSEDALETLDSVDPSLMLRLVKEWMKMMLARGLVKILWYCWTLMRELA